MLPGMARIRTISQPSHFTWEVSIKFNSSNPVIPECSVYRWMRASIFSVLLEHFVSVNEIQRIPTIFDRAYAMVVCSEQLRLTKCSVYQLKGRENSASCYFASPVLPMSCPQGPFGSWKFNSLIFSSPLSRCRARRGLLGAGNLTFSIFQALCPVVVPAGAFWELKIWLSWFFKPLVRSSCPQGPFGSWKFDFFNCSTHYSPLFILICPYLPLFAFIYP